MNEDEIRVPLARESERQVIGAMLAAGKPAVLCAQAAMSADDLYSPALALIWSVCADLVQADQAIDAIVVLNELRRRGHEDRAGGGAELVTLMDECTVPASVGHFAREVHQKAQLRRASVIHARIGQALNEISDHDDLLGQLAKQAVQLELLVDEREFDAPVEGLSTWSELWRRHPSDEVNWLVPNLLLARDVMFLLAGEGGGKSMLSRQFVLSLAAGIHPFRPDQHIEPARTLLCDLENAVDMLSFESQRLGHQVLMASGVTQAEIDERSFVLQREDGLNIRDPKDARLLERVIADTQPQFVAIGSLYNTFRRAGDAWDTAAEEVRTVLNRIRRRYGCAFLIEHHAPAAQGGARPMNPYGGSDWMKWPSVGRFITRVGDNAYELGNFREADRLFRPDMPMGLYRGGPLPWNPIWDPTDLRYGMWDHVRKAKDKAGEHA